MGSKRDVSSWRRIFPPMLELLDRIKSRIIESPWEFLGEPCWLWLGYTNEDGYGVMRYRGSVKSVHRWVYLTVVGAISKGLELDHLCEIRGCCNPRHLEAVPHKVNVGRGRLGQVTRARQLAKTHCPQGHSYAENLLIHKSGHRRCAECHRIRQREYKAKLRLEQVVKPVRAGG
jgi:hypothetical protein